MSIRDIWSVLRRRWYVMLPVTLLGLLAGSYLYTAVPVGYRSQSSVALLDSTAVAKLAPGYGNPIANAGGPLVVTADVLIRTLASSSSAEALRNLGVTDEYTVGFAQNTSGPLLTLTVTGDDSARVLQETGTLTAFAAEELRALQAQSGVPNGYFVHAAPVVPPQSPVPQSATRDRYAAGAGLLGTTAAFLLSFVVEAARRRGAARPSAPATGDGRPDATAILTGYLALALFVPSNLALPALGGIGTPANVFALLGLLWYLAAWLGGRLLPAPGSRAPRVAICVLAAAVLASYVAGATRSSSHKELLGADRGLVALLAWVSLVALASAGIQDRARLDVLLRRLVVMGTVVAAIGWYEFFAATNVADAIHLPGLQSSTAAVTAMDRGSFTRPRSTAAHPLEFGGTLAILLPFAVQQALDPARRHLGAVRRWAPVAIMGGALPLTVSRTSVIGAAVVVLVMLPRWRPQRRWAAIGLLVAAVAGLKALIPGLIGTITGLFAGFLSNSDSSTQTRTVKYGLIVPYLGERPWFGRGFGTFTPDLYFFTDNEYLLLLVETGVLGVVALLTLCATGIHNGGAVRRLARTEADRELGQAFFASAVVTLVVSATFDSLSFPTFAGVFFLTLGAGGSLLGFVRREAAAPPTTSPKPSRAVQLPVESR